MGPTRSGAGIRRCRHHLDTSIGRRPEDAVVSDEMAARAENQRDRFLDQLVWREHDMGRAISPSLLETNCKSAIRQLLHTIIGYRRLSSAWPGSGTGVRDHRGHWRPPGPSFRARTTSPRSTTLTRPASSGDHRPRKRSRGQVDPEGGSRWNGDQGTHRTRDRRNDRLLLDRGPGREEGRRGRSCRLVSLPKTGDRAGDGGRN